LVALQPFDIDSPFAEQGSAEKIPFKKDQTKRVYRKPFGIAVWLYLALATCSLAEAR
jgi:hypothetical protein